MNIKFLLPCFGFAMAVAANAGDLSDERRIVFPDVPGYQTLICDLHQHTVFSDGNVWPNIRVQEASRDGLDAIAVTEHLEYQPHKDDIPHPDRKRAYEISSAAAKGTKVLVISGCEITRDMPPGHANAIFLQDPNLINVEDPIEAYRAAGKQGAFIFWNHPNWTSQVKNGVARLTEMHRQLLAEKLLHGIEVVNSSTYSDEALQIALDHDLTILGTSDIHGLIDWDYDIPGGGHRPVTLVFAEERSIDGIKEGLMAGRTAVWFKNTLIGKREHLVPLIEASLNIVSAEYKSDSRVLSVVIENKSDVAFIAENQSGHTLHGDADVFRIQPNGTTQISVKTIDRIPEFEWEMKILNAVTAPRQHPTIAFSIKPEWEPEEEK